MAKKESTQKEEKKKKGKGKDDKASKSGAGAPLPGVTSNINDKNIDRKKVTPEELTQAQIEEAIKESQDPSTKLRKLRSPVSVRNCLINLLVLIVLTVGITLLCCYIMLDKETFSLSVVVKDIFDKLGVTKVFRAVVNWFKGIFK